MHETDDDHDHDHDDHGDHGRTAVSEVAPGGAALRVILTIVGAGVMILGAFLSWVNGAESDGVTAPANVFWSTGGGGGNADFITSAGAVVIVIALLALLGLTFGSGWLTRLAGALGVIAFILFVITLYRVDGGFGDVGLGMWAVLAGAILVLIGGFVGTRRIVT